MALFFVHCGYYDKTIENGSSECHANFFVAAESFAAAKIRAKALPSFKKHKMHIDTMQRIDAVDGCAVDLREESALSGETRVVTYNAWSRMNPDK